MKTKEGVVLAGLQLPMRRVLIEADKIWKEHGQELVITSTMDGVHSPGSLHPFGYAIDLRTNYFDEDTKAGVANSLRQVLGSDYDVILHKTHIHVEFDAILRRINHV